MIKVIFIIVGWIACGIAAAGIWNASFYDTVHNCGKQGAEDQASFLVRGVLGGPISLIGAMRDSGFAHSGWSLSTHSCGDSGRPLPYEHASRLTFIFPSAS
jgi:hypothetical protein